MTANRDAKLDAFPLFAYQQVYRDYQQRYTKNLLQNDIRDIYCDFRPKKSSEKEANAENRRNLQIREAALVVRQGS